MKIELIKRKFNELGIIYKRLDDQKKKSLEVLKSKLKENFKIQLTDELETFFLNFGDIKIDRGQTIVVKCIEKNPISNERKTAEVHDFFSFIEEDHSILESLNDYDNRLKNGMLPICESYFGDLICYHKSGAVYYWFHEFDTRTAFSLISNSLEEFFNSLEVKKDIIVDDIDVPKWKPSDKMKELLKKSGIDPRE